jgi:hypothetical protein
MQCDICNIVAGLSNLPTSSPAIGGIPHDNHTNATEEDDSNWLHRNNAYRMQQIGGRMRAVPTPHGHVPQANSTIIDITQGTTNHHSCNSHNNNIIVTYNDLMQHTAGTLTQLPVLELPTTCTNGNLYTPDCTIETAG